MSGNERSARKEREEKLWLWVRPMLVECCTTLFSNYNMTVNPLADEAVVPAAPKDQDGLAGWIGFTGAHMRGSLAIELPAVLARSAHPVGVPEGKDQEDDHLADLRDWVGEIANQLGGRLKNKLIPYGVVLELSTPLCISGNHLCTTGTQGVHILHGTSEHGPVSVHWDVLADPALVLAAAPTHEPPAEEGELMMF